MKSADGESQKESKTEHDSPEIYDFLYVDRGRISALYAQLFPQGVLTGVKTTAQETFSDESDVGTDVKVFKAGTKASSGGSEGVEHQFDASWAVPLEVLASLKGRSLVRETLTGAGLGSIILTDCWIRIVDFAGMAKMWGPVFGALVASGQPLQPPDLKPELVPLITEAMNTMPHAIHAQFLTKDAFLWSSLQPESLTIPTTDLTLKYGGLVPGQYKLLYLLDAWADNAEPPNVGGWSGGALIDAVLGAMHMLRTVMGRPAKWHGATPLMIYRDIKGWLPPSSLSSPPLSEK